MRFTEFARACGVDIRRLRDDGKIHRCPTLAHPRSTNGAYAFDGTRGWVMAWDAGGETQWYEDPNAKPWTDEQKAAWLRERDAARALQDRKYREAAERAAGVMKALTPRAHGYLRLKGFGSTKALVADTYTRLKKVRQPEGSDAPDKWATVTDTNVMFVPMRDRSGNLRGGQMIFWSEEDRAWVKEMTPGMRAKGAVLRLGPLRTTLTILCEGFATGLSIQAAVHQMRLRAEILVCFSDSNMVHVAEGLVGPVIVSADNDVSGAGERAAKAIGRPYFMAPTVGHDANDWHQDAGLMPLCAAIMRARADIEVAMR